MSSRHKAAARLRVAVNADGPGAAVLALRDQDIVYTGHRGLADLATRTPISATTAFDLASVSKHFTAVALLLLEERGQISLDAPLADYLPAWAEYPSGRLLTLADLLYHTSGIPDYSQVWRGAVADANLPNDRYLRKVLTRPALFPAGSRADYSNTNYILLAAVIEVVSGQSFRTFLRQNLFDPLGMNQSDVAETPRQPIAGRATGYLVRHGVARKNDRPISLVGHSHLFSTTADLAKWYRALWSGRVIREPSLAKVLTPGRLDDGTRHIYALGWIDDIAGEPYAIGHSGSWYGFATNVRRYPAENLTLVVLSNDENFGAKALTARLASAVLPVTPTSLDRAAGP